MASHTGYSGEVWNLHPGQNLFEGPVRLPEHLALVNRREFAILVDDCSVDDHRLHAASVSGKDQVAENLILVAGAQRRKHLVLRIDDDEIRLSAGGQLASVDTKRFRSIARCHA